MNPEPDTQEPVLALLGDPATYLADAEKGGQAVKRIDTHAASVFLAGARALKIKRAVKFPFLDFSTLAKRKAACAAELEVNRPFAPQIYRRVVPITRQADGALALDGGGEPVEWAVEMRRFDEAATLDHLADQGRIDTALADTLGRIVAAAHAQAPPVEPRPWIDAIADYIAEHEAEFGRTPELFAPAAVEALGRASRAAYERIRPLLVERGRRGLIRRIHGDLHLGNIALIEGEPVLFDAIEFSPLIGSGDVLYNLAFLLMDLIERGLPQPANAAFNRYLAQTRRAEDLDALAALPFYLSMRAAIRAKVTAERRERAAPAEQAEIGASARRYFDLAARAIAPPPAVLLATGGRSGTGKSALARALAAQLAPMPGAVVLRSDAERKALFGKAESEKLPPEAYAASVTRQVYAAIADQARRALAAGHSVILDAVFAQPAERLLAEASAAVLGVAFHGLFLEAPLATRLARVGGRSRDASDADAAAARAQESYDLGPLTWTRIDASGTPEDTLRGAQARLG
jgi:aminoglycoside phosphotransferase family enzyme/predicted kinase